MLSVINKYSDVKRCTLLNYQVQYLLGKSLLQGYQGLECIKPVRAEFTIC